jgi:hypothetical protein
MRGPALVSNPSNSDPATGPGTRPTIPSSRCGHCFGIAYPRYTWQVWTKDGTRYEFSDDLWWGYEYCQGGQGDYAYMETYKWLLSRVMDARGNTISYTYGRDWQTRAETCFHVQGTVEFYDYSTAPLSGLWRSFSYESQAEEKIYDPTDSSKPTMVKGTNMPITQDQGWYSEYSTYDPARLIGIRLPFHSSCSGAFLLGNLINCRTAVGCTDRSSGCAFTCQCASYLRQDTRRGTRGRI